MVVLTFDRALADLEPEDFVRNLLSTRLAVRHVVMGYDFHFGQGRAREAPPPCRPRARHSASAQPSSTRSPTRATQHSPFSSSAIRQALHHGNMSDAAHDLGYNWMVMGEVVKGDQRGRTIGFPTLNIILDQGADPFRGIYAVRVRDAQIKGAIAWPGAGYFGDRPTFDTGRTFLEVYLIGFSTAISMAGRCWWKSSTSSGRTSASTRSPNSWPRCASTATTPWPGWRAMPRPTRWRPSRWRSCRERETSRPQSRA